MAEVSDTADPRSPAAPPGWRPWTLGGLVEGLNAVGTLCIFAVMILINLDILGRFAFSSPVPGVKEMVELSIVGIVFLQLPHTLRVGRIMRSDAAFNQLLARFPRVAHVLSALYNLTGALFAAAGLSVIGACEDTTVPGVPSRIRFISAGSCVTTMTRSMPARTAESTLRRIRGRSKSICSGETGASDTLEAG